MASNRLKKMVIQGPAGLNYFSRPELAYADIIKVTRERQVHFITADDPSPADKPEVQYVSGEGKFVFSSNNPFNFAVLNPDGSRVIEYVYIIYKRGGGVVFEAGPPENN